MALIICPKCGKNISDTVDTCIHCGASLSEMRALGEMKDYGSLCQAERDTLMEEFNKTHPRYKLSDFSYEKKMRASFIWFGICGLVLLVFIAIIFMFDYSIIVRSIQILLVAVGFLLIVGYVIYVIYLYIQKKRYDKKSAAALNEYAEWLRNEKSIRYSADSENRVMKF